MAISPVFVSGSPLELISSDITPEVDISDWAEPLLESTGAIGESICLTTFPAKSPSHSTDSGCCWIMFSWNKHKKIKRKLHQIYIRKNENFKSKKHIYQQSKFATESYAEIGTSIKTNRYSKSRIPISLHI